MMITKHKLLPIAVVLLLHVLLASAYQVRRNVRDFGAKGDGRTDDTQAIILALTQGRGDNPSAPYGSTTYSESTKTPAYVYFPGGTYVVSASLPVIYYTQMVGDPQNVPTIKFTNPSGVDTRVLEVAGQWYTGVNQDNFYRAIRNFVIDMTGCQGCTGVHWQVAQATSITNVYFKCGIGAKCQGMWMENGSGGFISDVVFEGGTYGMWVGNQQFTSRNITIRSVSTAGIYLNWDWVWTFKNLQVSNAPVAVDVADGIGSTVIIDSKFTNCDVGVRTQFSTSNHGVNSVLLDNLVFDNSKAAPIVQDKGQTMLNSNGGTTTVKSWAQGYMWNKGGGVTLEAKDLSSVTPKRPAELTPSNGVYFEKTRPDFQGVDQVDVSTLGVVGDGNTDVTTKLQQALNSNAGKAVLFFPHGIYIISNTVTIPPGSRLVGEAWSVLLASGSAFSNANNPIPMLQVGTQGQTGIAQLVDFMIGTRGPQPGAKLVEWNMHDSAPGSCGMWDVHFRVGGAIGTNISPSNCPRGDGSSAPASVCTGAWGLMHVTAQGNLYMENVWGWTADHDIDFHDQINVYNARGFLCESKGPMWLYGTAMEHSVLYQYNFKNANNVFMGAIQTETPYYQPSSRTPFTRSHPTDPSFCTNDARCNMAYGLVIADSSNIWLYSAGLYSFFNVWDQSCLKGNFPSCQLNMAQIENSNNLYMYALSTYGSVYMLSSDEAYSKAENNQNTFCSTAIVNLNYF